MSNNTDFTNIIFKQQIMDIVGAVLAEKTLQLREEISDRVSELFKGLPAIVIDTHGLEMHGLIEVAEALKEEQEFAHTIYYDVTSKKVYIRTNNVRGMQNDVDLLSPRC